MTGVQTCALPICYLFSIQAPKAWDLSVGNNNVVIAIIDSGVDIDHPDLKFNLWHNGGEIAGNNIDDDNNGYIDDYRGWDFITNSPDPRPKFDGDYSFLGINHGTLVAGVAAAQGNNSLGIAGVAWHAKIMPLRVLSGDGTGNTLDVARAIDYARENGADIINLSFTGHGKSTTLENAIYRANQAGILVVAAAGNEVDQGVDTGKIAQYPVCHDGGYGNNWVIGVASTDKSDRLASFSNYGKCIDIIAPGTGIYSTLYKDKNNIQFHRQYGGYWSGTSVSAPQVAGVAALVKSLKPKLTLSEIKDLILNNTDNIDSKNMIYRGKIGRGKLNAYKVLTATKNFVSGAEHKIDSLIVGAASAGGPHIKDYQDGKLYSQFFSFNKNKRFGTNVASSDFDSNGQAEIIAAGTKGEEPWVKIFSSNGKLQTEFLAFDKSMKQGINVAAGDLNNDGGDEIVVVAQNNYIALVKIFNSQGILQNEFLAFNEFFKGGLSLAVGDVNHDGFAEIIVATGPGSTPLVRIFNYYGQQIGQFVPYQPTYMRGVTVAAGDVDNDGFDEIITGTRQGGGPQVRIFDWQGRVESQFFAYNQNFLGGVNVAAGDINADGKDEIITGAGPGGGPHVRVFNAQGEVIWQFFAYNEKFTGGVYVASGK